MKRNVMFLLVMLVFLFSFNVVAQAIDSTEVVKQEVRIDSLECWQTFWEDSASTIDIETETGKLLDHLVEFNKFVDRTHYPPINVSGLTLTDVFKINADKCKELLEMK